MVSSWVFPPVVKGAVVWAPASRAEPRRTAPCRDHPRRGRAGQSTARGFTGAFSGQIGYPLCAAAARLVWGRRVGAGRGAAGLGADGGPLPARCPGCTAAWNRLRARTALVPRGRDVGVVNPPVQESTRAASVPESASGASA